MKSAKGILSLLQWALGNLPVSVQMSDQVMVTWNRTIPEITTKLLKFSTKQDASCAPLSSYQQNSKCGFFCCLAAA